MAVARHASYAVVAAPLADCIYRANAPTEQKEESTRNCALLTNAGKRFYKIKFNKNSSSSVNFISYRKIFHSIPTISLVLFRTQVGIVSTKHLHTHTLRQTLFLSIYSHSYDFCFCYSSAFCCSLLLLLPYIPSFHILSVSLTQYHLYKITHAHINKKCFKDQRRPSMCECEQHKNILN